MKEEQADSYTRVSTPNFPWAIVILRITLAVIFIASGLWVMAGADRCIFAVYGLSTLWTLIAIVRFARQHEDSSGRRCDLGIGPLVSRVFRRGHPQAPFQRTVVMLRVPLLIMTTTPLCYGLVHAMKIASPLEALPFLLNGLTLGLIMITSSKWACPYCLVHSTCSFLRQ